MSASNKTAVSTRTTLSTRRGQTTEADRIADAVMASDLDPTTKVKIFALISNVKRTKTVAKAKTTTKSKSTIKKVTHQPPKKTPGRRLIIDVVENPTATPRGRTYQGALDVEIQCPECGSKYWWPKLKLRRKHACPLCGKHVKVR